MGAERKPEMKRAFKEKMKSKAKERKQNLKEKRSRLIVKNLPFTVTEEKLKTHFETFGKVTSVQLLKKEDGKLMGCGFVQFEAVQKAAKAKFHLNGKEFLGRVIECDFTMPKKQFEKKAWQEKRQKYFDEQKIKQEPIDIDEIKEEAETSKEGNDELVEIKPEDHEDGDGKDNSDVADSEADSDEEDKSKDSEEEKEDTSDEEEEDVEEVEETKEDEKKSESIEKKGPFESHDVNEGKTIFVKNLPFDATNEDLKECMLQFGHVYYALVCIDKVTEHSKGTGFVKFRNKEDADKCLQAGTELNLMDTILDCHLAIDRRQIETKAKEKVDAKQKDSRNLYLIKEGVILAGTKAAEGVSASDMAKRLQLEQYKTQMLRNLNMFISKNRLIIHNLPPTWDDSKLRSLLKKHAGPGAIIKESRVMRNMKSVDSKGTGLSKEHGFVSFTSHEHAINALRSLNNNPRIFSEAKRPIVAFSIENRVMVNMKQKRMEKSRQMNPLAKQFDPVAKKEFHDWRNQNQNQNQPKPQRTTNVIEGDAYTGTKGKPGVVQKMRSKYKLKTQAQTHNEQLKAEKRQRKNVTKSLQQRKEEFIRQDGQKINNKKRSREAMDDNFAKMVNDYKSKLLKGHSSGDVQTRGKWTDG